MAALDIVGAVAGAGTAMSGLVLVFLGATSSAFESYQPQERKAVLGKYKKRANFAFAGLLISAATVVCALLADWMDAAGLAVASFLMLVASILLIVFSAYISVGEIK